MNQTINNVRNELVENGWSRVKGSCANKYVYRKSHPYDEFIIEQLSSDEVAITVPIPFRESSISYKNTFRSENMDEMQEYIKLHLCNNNNRQ